MRLDHIAYRVKDRLKTAKFFKKAFGYKIGTEFQIEFDDESKAECLALVPPEKRHTHTENWIFKKTPAMNSSIKNSRVSLYTARKTLLKR